MKSMPSSLSEQNSCVPDSHFDVVHRRIVSARLGEDGWYIEVEDSRGARLDYWIASRTLVPAIGAVIRFYHRQRDMRLSRIDIDGGEIVCIDAE